jgi:asparagine synthase (glutamine-hydrolysing)
MCGIAGFTHPGGKPDPVRIANATLSLKHRGPDQDGTWESGDVSLGAVRLKILDLEGGDQPIVSPDGGTVIVYNGEVYNHLELREELETLGHRFQSHCDTETILHAFLEWDTRCFARMRGMFAVALWQQRERRLVLARDRLGIKPLYVCEHGGNLYFGSELKALFAHPEIPRRIDRAALSYYLSLNWTPGPYTLIEGISKVRPGHILEWRDGRISTEPFWSSRPWSSNARSMDQAKEELDLLLRQAVREHLLSDVPLGVWASGGLDSSTMVHYASQLFPGKLKTFSVSFAGKKFDESEYFRAVARHYGTEHHEFDLSEDEDIPGAVERIPEFSDEPSADAGALPVWFLSKMSRRDVTVVLSGEGADELFGGYNTYLADDYAAKARAWPRAVRQAALAAASVWPSSNTKIGLDYKVRRFLEGSLLGAREAHFYWNGTFSDAERRALYREDGGRGIIDLVRWMPAEFSATGPLNQWLWLDQKYYLADDILTKCDRMSMAHSLEVRPAFLDHRIVEFANSLPEDFKIRGGTLKFLLRELMRDKLPPVVIGRKKEGFDIPSHLWFRTILKPLLLDTVNERTVAGAGLFHWPEVKRVIDRHMRRRANYGYHLWGLLILFLWMKRWNVVTR